MFCAECGKLVMGSNYHTPGYLQVFCDAYCSNAWYSKTFEKMKADKDQTKRGEQNGK